MDWAYNCSSSNACPYSTPPYISNLVTADGGTGVPSGFTRSGRRCTPAALATRSCPRGNWYIDCAGGFSSLGATLTFRGGNIVADNVVSARGQCDAAYQLRRRFGRSTACPSDPATTTTVFLRNGGLTKSGNVSFTMLETFVYLRTARST